MTVDDSVLLHNDCVRLLKRKSQQNLVDEVMYKLFNCKADKQDKQDKQDKKDKENKADKRDKEDFIELLLFLFCCYFEN